MRPIVPSETQESETPGPRDQRDEKSPETGIHKLNFWLKDSVSGLQAGLGDLVKSRS